MTGPRCATSSRFFQGRGGANPGSYGPWNYGTLDKILGHYRRYTRDSLERLASDCELQLTSLIDFNRLGAAAWFVNGKLMRRRGFGLLQIWLLNLLTPLIRRIDHFLPLPPLSLIVVMEARGTLNGSRSNILRRASDERSVFFPHAAAATMNPTIEIVTAVWMIEPARTISSVHRPLFRNRNRPPRSGQRS